MVMLAGAGLGRLARGLRPREDESPDERFVLDTAIGLGVLSLVIFALGALQLYKWNWLVTAPVAACALLGLALVVPDAVSDLPAFFRRTRPAGTKVLAALVLLLALAALIPALAPPSMSDWDSPAYHLAMPKLWIEHGGFYYIDFASHSNFPSLTEMLYVPGLLFQDPAAAKMVHYWIWVLLVSSVAILARRHFGGRSAWPTAIAFAGMPIALWEATTAYVDLATALYTVLGVHLLLNHLDSRARRHLVGCAACAGFAASTKMTGLLLIPLFAIWLIAAGARRDAWKDGLVLVLVASAACSPWYLKSYLYTGNPVYPFFYSIFGGRDWSAELARNYAMLQSRFGLGHGPAALLTLPYDLAFRPDAFYDTPGLYVGPLFLVAVPILILGRYGSRKLVGLLAFFVAQVVAWFVLTQQSRYLIPAFAALAALVSGLAWENERFRRTRAALWFVFVGTAVFGMWTLSPFVGAAAPYVLGRESREEYLTANLDIYPAQRFVNDSLPAGAKVALFGDTRGFYLERGYVWADPGHNLRFSTRFKNVEEFVRCLRKAGITHALVNFRFFPSAKEARGTSRLVYEAVRSGRFRMIYPFHSDGRAVAVYEIR